VSIFISQKSYKSQPELFNERYLMKIKYNYCIIIILFNFLISCGLNKNKETITVPKDAKAGSLYLEPDIYTSGDIELKSHNGIIVVPENRSKSDSRLIALPIVQIHATGDSIAEPIFFLNGGPGNPNIKSYHFVNNLINNHDIVLVGYRGVEGSVVLNLPEVDEFFANMPGDLIEKPTLDSMSVAYAQGAKRLQREGVDTDGYTMTEVIQDFESARIALEYNKINLFSVSYGTRLAMIYDWMYPNTIHRSAMMCVNPPEHFEWRPEVMDDHLKHYSDLYKKDIQYGDPNIDIAEIIRKTSQNIPERWLFFPIKKGYVLMSTFMMLYSTENAPKLFDAWITAEKGDWSGIAMLSLSMEFMISGALNWGDLASKTVSSDYDYEPEMDLLSEFMPDNSIIGAPGSILGIGARGWPAKLIPDSLRSVKYSKTATLLINGNIDVSTPARFGREELLPYLDNGHQVIVSEASHSPDIWGKQRQALDHMLKTFFKTGVVDDSHYTYSPISFKVGLGYPTMMKLAVAGITCIIIILLSIVWFVVRKIRFGKRKV